MGNLDDLRDPGAATAEQIAMIQSELGKPGNSAADTAGLTRELARLGVGSSVPPAQLIGAMGSPEANAAMAEAGQGGALSQAATQTPVPQPTAQAPTGALTATSNLAPRLPTVQEALAQYMPQDDSRGRYLAMAAGLGSVTKTGGLGEQIGNVASAMQQQKQQQEQLRMQYLPHIMQQVASQQLQQFSIDNQKAMADRFGLNGPQNSPQGAPVAGAQPPTGSPIAPAAQVGGAAPSGATGAATVGQPATAGAQPLSSQAPVNAAPTSPAPVVAGASGPDKNGLWYPITPAEWASTPAGPAGDAARSALVQKHSEPPPQAMAAIAAGKQPGTQAFADYMQQLADKDVYINPTALRPASMFATGRKNPDGTPEYKTTPSAAISGTIYIADPTNPSGFKSVPIPNALLAIQRESEAKARGPGAVDTTTGYDVNNKAVTLTKNQAADMAAGTALPPGSPAGVATAAGQPLTLVQQPGAEKSANNVVDQANTVYKNVDDGANGAMTRNSLLNKVKQQALLTPTGAFSPTLEYANNIFALLGSKPAGDMVSAAEQARKASGQLVAGQSVGGMGTDQARTLLASITPGTTMQGSALAAVADNLIGSNDMIIGNRTAIQPHYLSGNAGTLLNTNKTFTDNADPVLFQHWNKWQSLGPGTPAAQRFAATLDPSERQRMGVLSGMGVLK
jgi:hypothetical protein